MLLETDTFSDGKIKMYDITYMKYLLRQVRTIENNTCENNCLSSVAWKRSLGRDKATHYIIIMFCIVYLFVVCL